MSEVLSLSKGEVELLTLSEALSLSKELVLSLSKELVLSLSKGEVEGSFPACLLRHDLMEDHGKIALPRLAVQGYFTCNIPLLKTQIDRAFIISVIT